VRNLPNRDQAAPSLRGCLSSNLRREAAAHLSKSPIAGDVDQAPVAGQDRWVRGGVKYTAGRFFQVLRHSD
jgi:hypothetical protein